MANLNARCAIGHHHTQFAVHNQNPLQEPANDGFWKLNNTIQIGDPLYCNKIFYVHETCLTLGAPCDPVTQCFLVNHRKPTKFGDWVPIGCHPRNAAVWYVYNSTDLTHVFQTPFDRYQTSEPVAKWVRSYAATWELAGDSMFWLAFLMHVRWVFLSTSCVRFGDGSTPILQYLEGDEQPFFSHFGVHQGPEYQGASTQNHLKFRDDLEPFLEAKHRQKHWGLWLFVYRCCYTDI